MIAYHEFIVVAELIGIAVFAITGAIAVPGKRIDIFGVVVLGIVTALGGGTLRDITLGLYPVAWVADTRYLWVDRCRRLYPRAAADSGAKLLARDRRDANDLANPDGRAAGGSAVA